VFVLAAVGCLLPSLGIAVQVQHVDLIEGFQQLLSHAAEGGTVQVAMVRDEAEDALPRALDAPLAQADELNVIILEPDLLLAKREAVDLAVVLLQARDP